MGDVFDHHESINQPTKTREGDQALPVGGGACVQDEVIRLMEESKRVGLERYGSVLRTFNGRRSIQDVAEEARDLMVYATQIVMEAEANHDELVGVVRLVVGDRLDEIMSPTVIDRIAADVVGALEGWVAGKLADEPELLMEPTYWWRVVRSDGALWTETSDEREAREALKDPEGARLERLYRSDPVSKWVVQP